MGGFSVIRWAFRLTLAHGKNRKNSSEFFFRKNDLNNFVNDTLINPTNILQVPDVFPARSDL